jgi:hypothetical protein
VSKAQLATTALKAIKATLVLLVQTGKTERPECKVRLELAFRDRKVTQAQQGRPVQCRESKVRRATSAVMAFKVLLEQTARWKARKVRKGSLEHKAQQVRHLLFGQLVVRRMCLIHILSKIRCQQTLHR